MGLLFLLSCASEYVSFSFESFLKFSLSIFEFCEWNFKQLLRTENKWQAALGGSGPKVLVSCASVVCPVVVSSLEEKIAEDLLSF